MMRAPGSLSIVCRKRDGSLILRERTIEAPASALVKAPFLRGMLTLFSSLKIGHQALRFSAEILEEGLAEEEAREEDAKKKKAKAPPGPATLALIALAQWILSAADGSEEEEPSKKEPAPIKKIEVAPKVKEEEPKSALAGLATAVPVLFAIGLFIALPQAAAEGINSWFKLGLDVTSPGFQVITGAAKLIIIVSYLAGIRMIPDVRRVFQYHGAEHKAISTYEAGKDLLVENARPTSALHARCGTTFIIMVAFVSVVLFSAVGSFFPTIPGPRFVQSIAFFFMKLPLFPVIAGITYELQRFFAKYCTTGPLRPLLWPGFLVQKITTAPPDDDQLEVALASLRSALANAPVKLPETHPDKQYMSYSDLVDDVVPRPA
ncbi:MAG: DUF1385 domain-containing protein [Polyangiaceae bacterium]|nr:DUF1385 domain-containing protein [Polyangiaceae bacterium]